MCIRASCLELRVWSLGQRGSLRSHQASGGESLPSNSRCSDPGPTPATTEGTTVRVTGVHEMAQGTQWVKCWQVQNRQTDDGHVFYANSIVSCCIANCLPLAIAIDADSTPPPRAGICICCTVRNSVGGRSGEGLSAKRRVPEAATQEMRLH